jgi:hypothetical protein
MTEDPLRIEKLRAGPVRVAPLHIDPLRIDPLRIAPLRIAMWSGPRNISTAMMRAFENRPDTAVVDEPFYAAYLAATGLDHPMREAVLASQPQDWREVAATLLGPVPGSAPVYYQKHMAHHMLPRFGTEWMASCTNVFLIRRPEEVIASYSEKRGEIGLADIGIVRQAELFDQEADRLGMAPLVIDSAEITASPAAMLGALCTALGLEFTPAMIAWPALPTRRNGHRSCSTTRAAASPRRQRPITRVSRCTG